MKTKKTGFTLIELLVVIAIIAVLMAILIPALRSARENARRVICSSQCKQIGVAHAAYAADYDNSMPWWGYGADNKEDAKTYTVYRADSEDLAKGFINPVTMLPYPLKFACFYEGKYITEPEMFYCPSNKNDLYKFESYNNPAPWGPETAGYQVFNADPRNDWVRMGYTYFPTNPRTKKNDEGVPKFVCKKIQNLNPRIPYMTDVIRHLDELSHTKQNVPAVNALFSGGHVVFCNDEAVFSHQAWVQIENGEITERALAYRIFRMIPP